MRIRLLVAMKVRDEQGNSRILYPGIFDDSRLDFPEVLRNESRPGIVEILDSPVNVPGSPVTDETEPDGTDPDDETNDDIADESNNEVVDESDDEVIEDVAEKPKKKDKIKRRG